MDRFDAEIAASDELEQIVKGFLAYLTRRGGACLHPPTSLQIQESLLTGKLLVPTGELSKDVQKNGVRMFKTPLLGLFFTTAHINKVLVSAERFGSILAAASRDNPGYDLLLIAKPDMLRTTLASRAALHASNLGITVRYRPYRTFVINLPEHVSALCVQHKILTKEETIRECSFYRRPVSSFASLSVSDPLAFWAGVRHGDLVLICGGATGSPTCNLRHATSGIHTGKPETTM